MGEARHGGPQGLQPGKTSLRLTDGGRGTSAANRAEAAQPMGIARS